MISSSMQLFILTTLISFIVAAPSLDGWNGFGPNGDIFGNDIGGAVHSQSNNCNNDVKNIGVGHAAIDNSCTNTAIEFGTDDHSGSNNGWGVWDGLDEWDE